MTAMWVDVGGAATLGVDERVDRRDRDLLARAFAPYRPATGVGAVPDVLVEPLADEPSILAMQNGAGDGLVTAHDGENAFMLRNGGACAVPDPLHDIPARFAFTARFPLAELAGTFVRTAVALAALRHDAVVVHASAVSLNGRAVLVGGWSESGKTEISLALAEAGAELLSDKWTIVRADGSVCPFPASVGIRRWVLQYLPRLRAALPMRARAQLQAAGIAGAATAPVRRPYRSPVRREVASQLTRLADLGDRAGLWLEEARAAYGVTSDVRKPVPLGLVVLLSTIPSPTRESGESSATASLVDPSLPARRLALAAAFERRAFFSVTERVRYGGFARERADAAATIALEAQLLDRRFRDLPALELSTPFPSDPRVAARIILERPELG